MDAKFNDCFISLLLFLCDNENAKRLTAEQKKIWTANFQTFADICNYNIMKGRNFYGKHIRFTDNGVKESKRYNAGPACGTHGRIFAGGKQMGK
jgi:hypothetical protein